MNTRYLLNINKILILVILVFSIFILYIKDNNKNILIYNDIYLQKDFNILMKCYNNINYINSINYKNNKTIIYYYKYFNIGNLALTYDEIQHPSYTNKIYKNKISKYQPCLYIMKSLELSYKKYDIFKYY